MTTLPPDLAHELRAVAAARLRQALDAMAHAGETAPADEDAPRHLRTVPLPEAGPRLARDAHVLLTGDRRDRWHAEWVAVRRRRRELLRLVRGRRLPADLGARQDRLVSLTCVAAGVLVPLLAAAGRYRRAVGLAAALRRAVTDKAHRRVVGAGAGGPGEPRLRLLLLSPVFWSLAAYCPAALRRDDHDRDLDD